MKRSETPTKWLLLPAFTGSEWDNVDYALLELTDGMRKHIQSGAAGVDRLNPQPGDDFAYLSLWCSPHGWYVNGEEEDWGADEKVTFVDMEDTDPESLPRPEQQVCRPLLVFSVWVYAHGTDKRVMANFKAYGKHTSEEFWTEEFDVRLTEEAL